MTPRTILSLVAALLVPAVFVANAQTTRNGSHPAPQAVANYGELPLNFEPNLGQTSKEVNWLARTPEYTLFLAGHDAVVELNDITPGKRPGEAPSIRESAVRMNLLGAEQPASSTGEVPLAGKVNYFTGKNAANWQRNVSTYSKVHLQKVYPGIDLVYYGTRGQLEYDFNVAPGADASAIRMKFDGGSPTLAANGDLVLPVQGTNREIRFNKPLVYQMENGVRRPVDGSFVIAENQQVSFKLGAYDLTRELVIDPTLLFLGTLGTGNQQSVSNGMAVDASGEIVLTGITNDLTFPVTAGALQPSCTNASTVYAANYVRCGPSSGSSGFVTKISADGRSLVYSTYLHGLSGNEYGEAVQVDAAGDAYVMGNTSSNDFPITSDAFQPYCQPYYQTATQLESTCDGYFAGGGTEFVDAGPTIFLVKLNPSGSSILYGTFFGGTDGTYPGSLALDSSNNIYFTSFLQDAEPTNNVYPVNGKVPFPVTTGAYQSYGVGLQAATLSKLSADGHTLMYSTVFGTLATGTYFAYTQPEALAVGSNGIAFMGGLTFAAQLPTTAGAVRPNCVVSTGNSGNCEAYTGWLAAFDTTKAGAASLLYSTYIGGTEVQGSNLPQNQVLGLTADSSNNVYVTGQTLDIDYPTTTGVYQPTCNHANGGNSCSTAFLTKINPTGSAYVWSTFFGGTNPNPAGTLGYAVALDAQGRVYLYGSSQDGGGDLPTVNPLEGYFSGNKLFIATFTPDAKQLLFATRLGNTSTTSISGDNPITNNGMVLDATGNIYFAGDSADNGSMVTTPGTYTTTATSGFTRTFFGKISPVLAPDTTTLTVSPATTSVGQSVTFSGKVVGTTQTTPVPTGTLTLQNISTTPATTLGSITLDGTGAGTYTTTALPASSYSLTATYSGDANYAASTSAAQTLTVNSLPVTSTALTVSPTGSLTYGQQVTLTATVTQTGGGVPSGTVTFTAGSIVLGTGTLNGSGVATLTTTVPAGTSSLVAAYGGSSSSSSSTGTGVMVTIAKAPLTITAANATKVAGAANPTFTGTVTGTVNNDVLTPSYTSTATTSSPAGTYAIVPSITGANIANYTVTAVNGTLTVTVPVVSTTTTLTSSATTSVSGASITFTAVVSPASGSIIPTGTVTFKDGSTTLGTGTLDGTGKTTYATATLAVGAHSITASYGGDSGDTVSTSSALNITVTAPPVADFSLSLSPTSGSITAGSSTTVTVTVTPVNGFNSATSLACTGLPSYSTCAFNPTSVTPNGTAASTSTLTIATNVSAALRMEPRPGAGTPRSIEFAGILLSIFLVPLAGWRNRKLRKMLAAAVPVLLLALAAAGMSGCGSSSNGSHTPTGNYTVTVTGTSGSLSHSATYSITVN
jgi:hypothetical protein